MKGLSPMTPRALMTAALMASAALALPAHAADEAATAPEAAARAPVPVASAPAAGPATASTPSGDERLQITEPYLELHTGPGRGYPVFFVAGRDEWITIELRHTDWYKVRTEGGKVGWVNRAQLESTLTAAGSRKSFRDILLDDYLSRRVQLGAAWGHFKSEPMLKLFTSYRLSETLSVEGTIGQVQGAFSGTDFWHINLASEPWSDQRLSPFFGIGFGKFTNIPNQSLVAAQTTNAKLADAIVGVRYHLTDRFVLQADYAIYTAFVADTHSAEYRAFTLGISFFF
jgi:uncharacterized protein YgiM (DUF1202 family)